MEQRLLSVGTNLTLLKIRHLVFINAGYKVIAARSEAAAIRAIESGELDAVVVGHSLTKRLKALIVDVAKDSNLPVIVLHTNPHEEAIARADANLCGIDGAARILELLSDYLGSNKAQRVTSVSRRQQTTQVARTQGLSASRPQ